MVNRRSSRRASSQRPGTTGPRIRTGASRPAARRAEPSSAEWTPSQSTPAERARRGGGAGDPLSDGGQVDQPGQDVVPEQRLVPLNSRGNHGRLGFDPVFDELQVILESPGQGPEG